MRTSILVEGQQAFSKYCENTMLIATKPRHQAINNTAQKLKLEILGNELDVVTKARNLSVQVDDSLD